METDTRPKKFRSSVGGYNKEDVNNYIKETDLQYSSGLAELQAAIDALKTENAALLQEKADWQKQEDGYKASLAEASAKAEENTALLAEKDGCIQDLQKRLDICRAQTEAQNTVIEQLRQTKVQSEKKIEALTESLKNTESALRDAEEKTASSETMLQKAVADADALRREMEAAVADEKARAAAEIADIKAALAEDENSPGYKIQMYDKISGQIGDILLGANRNADEILSAAQEDAEKLRADTTEEMEKSRAELQTELERIREETRREAEGIRERLSVTAASLLSSISDELHGNTENCLKELATCMTELAYETETVLQNMQNRYREMNDRIQYYQSCAQDNIEKQLQDIDKAYDTRKTGSAD